MRGAIEGRVQRIVDALHEGHHGAGREDLAMHMAACAEVIADCYLSMHGLSITRERVAAIKAAVAAAVNDAGRRWEG